MTVEPAYIGPYTVLKLLGRGGQAVVYLCRTPDSNEEVAVKLMTSTSGTGDERFRREILLSRLLTHPNIVRILDDGVHEDAPYVVMEVLPDSLETMLRDLDGDPMDGTSVSRLIGSADIDSGPTWSPDGTRIAFASDRYGSDSHIYVMNPDGTGVTRLTSDTVKDQHPAWSPPSVENAALEGLLRSDADRIGNIRV